jgi:hypothetical protein
MSPARPPARPCAQVQLSHTPMQALVPRFANERVLCVGREGADAICRHYGFKDVVTIGHVHAQYPEMYPDTVPTLTPPANARRIAAVLVFMQPDDWNRDLQARGAPHWGLPAGT